MPSTTVIGCVQADVVMSPVTDLPAPGGTLLAERTSIRVGGAGANAALALVETGTNVRLVGCIGDDHVGRWMAEELAPVGLADELVVVAGEPSGLTVALQSDVRDRTFLTYLGVNANWAPSTIPADALACENLLLCDYFVAPRLQGAAAHGLLSTARANGARTFFDTAWDPAGFPEQTRTEIAQLLPWVDVFLPNEDEARALTGLQSAFDAGRALQAISDGWIVVKLGARGCAAFGPEALELQQTAPAVDAADTTGAGDAFNAGLVNALSTGAGWPEALESATGFASEIISRPSFERY